MRIIRRGGRNEQRQLRTFGERWKKKVEILTEISVNEEEEKGKRENGEKLEDEQ